MAFVCKFNGSLVVSLSLKCEQVFQLVSSWCWISIQPLLTTRFLYMLVLCTNLRLALAPKQKHAKIDNHVTNNRITEKRAILPLQPLMTTCNKRVQNLNSLAETCG